MKNPPRPGVPETIDEIELHKGHDACGVTAIQNPSGASREVVDLLLRALCDNEIRAGSANGTGDGAGIMLRTDDDLQGNGMQSFLKARVGRNVPLSHPRECLHSGRFFIDQDWGQNKDEIGRTVETILAKHGLAPLQWSKVPDQPRAISARARAVLPGTYEMIYGEGSLHRSAIRTALFQARLEMQRELEGFSIISLQPGTVVYKGMVEGHQLPQLYPELRSPEIKTDAAIGHTRFSTNVLAHSVLAQPFELIAHNGEVNSIRVILETLFFLERQNGLMGSNIMGGGSDSANMDRALQMLHSNGLSLQESVRFMMHPAPDDLARMPRDSQDYFKAVSRVLGSLKAVGPIALVGMDRDFIIASLDNMGLRPLRILERDDGLTIITSEAGIPLVDPARILKMKQLGPGQQVKIERGRGYLNPRLAMKDMLKKTDLNYEALANENKVPLSPRSEVIEDFDNDPATLVQRAHLFGMNSLRLRQLKAAVGLGKDPVDGMGSDLAVPGFDEEPHSLGHYLRANYSQVTNPSVDPIRRLGAFSLETLLGSRSHMVEFAREYTPRPQYTLGDPLLDRDQIHSLFASIEAPNDGEPKAKIFSTLFSPMTRVGLEARMKEIEEEVLACADSKSHSIMILSDRHASGNGEGYIPPHILASHLKKALDSKGLSNRVSLVMDTGEVLDQHEFTTLIGCGADAVHPHMIYEFLAKDKLDPSGLRDAFNYTLLRYMAKLGLNDIDAYRGGKQFSTLGLDKTFAKQTFGDIETNGSGLTLEELLKQQQERSEDGNRLRRAQDRHAYGPSIWKALQAVGESDVGTAEEAYEMYLAELNNAGSMDLRDLLQFDFEGREPIPVEEVMPAKDIIANFIRGADISYGSINGLSHSVFHEIFNQFGSYAGSGEGGVPLSRLSGDGWKDAFPRSLQVASGRFGIHADLIAHPEVRQIKLKVGQGAKPGVGGHLPGRKVHPEIAKTRAVAIGQDLISPTNNSDIYSIEDLMVWFGKYGAANPSVDLSIKLTSGANIGTIAVGAAKAGAEKIQISGHKGGTGAATMTDKFFTGLPVELGIMRADNALIEQGLREETKLVADSGIRSGSDIAKLLILGADEVEIATAILIAQQKCIFCNRCSTQQCPSDITRTRERYLGSEKGRKREALTPEMQREQLVQAGSNFLELMAEEMRTIMAKMGVRNPEELIGNRDFLKFMPGAEEQAKLMGMSAFLNQAAPVFEEPDPLDKFKDLLPESLRDSRPTFLQNLRGRWNGAKESAKELRGLFDQNFRSDRHDPNKLAYYLNHPKVTPANRKILQAVENGESHVNLVLKPNDRAVGATLAAAVQARGIVSPNRNPITIESSGWAGQAYAFMLSDGIIMRHRGAIQNEGCESQSGGRVVILPPAGPRVQRHDLDLVGNTLAYGARGGDRFICGSIGDQGCIRESGGRTIITGNTGKYFAEYKTGGRDLVLGKLGNAVGTGMSGGSIYTRDERVDGLLSEDAVLTKVMRERDLLLIHEDLEELFQETRSPEVHRILHAWDRESRNFRKVIAREHYEKIVLGFLYEKRHVESMIVPDDADLLADLLEMTGVDIDSVKCSKELMDRLKVLLASGLTRMQEDLRGEHEGKAIDEIENPEKFLAFITNFAKEMTEKIQTELTRARTEKTMVGK